MCVDGVGTVDEKRSVILKMKDDVLTELFKAKPDIKAQIQSAPGYAVSSNANLNIFFVAAGTGYGVTKDMRTQNHTYMNMAEVGVGLGFGAKDYRLVIVFHKPEALNDFIQNGWSFGGNADAAAIASDKGVAVQSETYYGDMTVYTFTETGLALQATLKGSRFWKDKKLN
ncbi:MAG: lipid-binding SYLF domain-containing protein [Flavobacteriales bacterium]|jgi:lipid-binding SYLF domain-containing protein